MKNFSQHKISRVIAWWWHGLISDSEAERLIIIHHNKSKVPYEGGIK